MSLLKLAMNLFKASFVLNLHSTMSLLKQTLAKLCKKLEGVFTFHYVSIKTTPRGCDLPSLSTFTFHYVSIKTANIQTPHAGVK